jgi:hypothetical protein
MDGLTNLRRGRLHEPPNSSDEALRRLHERRMVERFIAPR